MLFNSYIFVFAFLPIVFVGFYALAPYALKWRVYWLTIASFFFYAWWNPPFLLLLLGSIGVNYTIGHWVGKTKSKIPLTLGIIFNLSIIGYFKYFWFILSQFISEDTITNNFDFASPLLPLGISFFTFQQIAYLVDRYQVKVKEHNLPEYALFVSFFPQLIAGPIVHQKEILPQLTRKKVPVNTKYIAMGLACFTLGLTKKTVLADPLGNIARPIFDQSLTETISFIDSWIGSLAYTLQLYFDFSGYSDMAIGLGLLFGIKIPLNFASPYKSRSIVEFWRTWHMTLSRFLRDYLYIPLGGNQKGKTRRYINLFITMLLGGLWHGAGWTFVIWGALHGLYLCINHFWSYTKLRIPTLFSWLITFVAVVFAWVIFRAETFDSALTIWQAMLSPNANIELSLNLIASSAMIAVGLIIALAFPNTQQWLHGKWWGSNIALIGRWKPIIIQAIAFAGLLWGSLLLIQFNQSEFLYFNF